MKGWSFLFQGAKLSDFDNPASTQTERAFYKFTKDLEFTQINVQDLKEKTLDTLKKIRKSNFIVVVYPTSLFPIRTRNNLVNLFYRLINFAFFRLLTINKKMIYYIRDIPIEQSYASRSYHAIDCFSFFFEKRIFRSAYKIAVFNERMKKVFQKKYQFKDEKFVIFEFLDFGIDVDFPENKKLQTPRKIVIASGTLKKKDMYNPIISLPKSKNIIYEIFGPQEKWLAQLDRDDIFYRGKLSQEDLLDYMAKNCDFGLIYRDIGNIDMNNYHNLTTTSKLRAYLTAGLPILNPKEYEYIAELLEKYDIGFTFNDINDIPKILDKKYTDEQYQKIRKNSIQMGQKLAVGYFFKKSIKEIITKFQKKK